MTREVSPAIAACQLTHVSRAPIDYATAVAQHRLYQRCLTDLGCTVHLLPADDTMPDSVFIEDTAVVVDELAVITRPGADSRRAETTAVADALRRYRSVARLAPPGKLDGGDVLLIDRTVHVGQSTRTDAEGTAQLARLLEPPGYTVHPVEVGGCLHLKTAVTNVAENTLLINPAWVRREAFRGRHLIEVDPTEPFAANALRVGDSLVYSSAFPRTRRRLEASGIEPRVVDATELAKAEGGVTCCSLLFTG